MDGQALLSHDPQNGNIVGGRRRRRSGGHRCFLLCVHSFFNTLNNLRLPLHTDAHFCPLPNIVLTELLGFEPHLKKWCWPLGVLQWNKSLFTSQCLYMQSINYFKIKVFKNDDNDDTKEVLINHFKHCYDLVIFTNCMDHSPHWESNSHYVKRWIDYLWLFHDSVFLYYLF
jgi:hypothetical protein